MIKKISSAEKQPFILHLNELRQRLLLCLITVFCAFILTYFFRDMVVSFLLKPFREVMPRGSNFIFTGVPEAFLAYFKIWIVTAVAIASPMVLYEMWMFVSPGLYENEKRYIYPLLFWGTLLFAAGVIFCYYIVMPYLYRFFVGYASSFIIPMPDLKNYVNLTLKLLFTFGLLFELPLVAFYLARAGVINHRSLQKKRRYAVLGAFILSAMITPPDIISQLILALPLWGLFELSIILARLFGKKERVHG